MTLSILAFDPRTGAVGGAAATGNLAVGAWVLRAAVGAGAVATQGHSVSPLWGDDALRYLHEGRSAEDIIDSLVKQDPGCDFRQLSVIDRQGSAAAWSGKSNTSACGHLIGDGYVVAGNWLSSLDVLEAMKSSYSTNSIPLATRLLQALEAGISTGSDSRGTLSAAPKVVRADEPPLDLRVDYDEEPLLKLLDIYRRATSEPYSGWMQYVPTINEPYRK